MANLNLSEFTEKLFVADADHTFIWDTQNAISKRVSRNSWLNSGTLTSDAPVTISQTWGTTGTYTAAKINVTETATANSASRLLDLQVGGVSLANFSKAGHLIFPSSSTVTPSGPGVGQWVGTLGLFGSGGSLLVTGSGSALNISGNVLLSWNNDTILLRDGAANTLALRNGAAAQTFNVYGTSSASNANYARLALTCGLDGNATISTQALGTGTAGVLAFSPGNSERMRITTAGNVGIGTTAPGAKLEVVGNILVNGATQIIDDGNILSVKGSTTNAFKAGYIVVTSGDNLVTTYQGSVTSGGFFGTFTNHKCFIRTNNVERVAIDTVGNVGIGTTSPTSKLEVAGAVTAAGYYTATSGGVSLVANGLWQQGTGHLTLASGAILGWSGAANVNIDQPGDTRLLRDEAYHLALRNGTNGQKFSVYGTYPGAAWERFTITAPTSGNVLLGTYRGTSGVARGLEFQTDGVTRMAIDSAGETFIGVGFTGLRVSVNAVGGSGSVANIGGGGAQTVTGRSGGSYGWTNDANSALHSLRDTALFRNAAGVVEINNGTAGAFRDLRVRSVIEQPPASITPALNGDLVVEATSNTTLTFKLKGTDGTVRSGTITLT